VCLIEKAVCSTMRVVIGGRETGKFAENQYRKTERVKEWSDARSHIRESRGVVTRERVVVASKLQAAIVFGKSTGCWFDDAHTVMTLYAVGPTLPHAVHSMALLHC
jgi:hypothetical protein